MKQSYLRRARGTLAAFIIASVVLEAGLTSLLNTNPSVADPYFRSKVSALEGRRDRRADSMLVVAFGSSRTFSDVDGERIEARLSESLRRPVICHNMGFTAAGPVATLVYLRRMVRAEIIPDLAILEVLPAFFSVSVAPVNVDYFAAARLSAEEVRFINTYLDASSTQRFNAWEGKTIPWYTLRAELLHGVSHRLLSDAPQRFYAPFDAHGFCGIPDSARTPDVFQRGIQWARAAYFDPLPILTWGAVHALPFAMSCSFAANTGYHRSSSCCPKRANSAHGIQPRPALNWRISCAI